MVLEILLAWTMLALVVWVGSRHTGRVYGFVFGALCGLPWILAAGSHLESWTSMPQALILGSGVLGLILVGILSCTRRPDAPGGIQCPPRGQGAAACAENGQCPAWLALLSDLPRQFAEWLEHYRQHIDPWPAFEYHIRTVLREACAATDVRAYRVLDEDLVVPLAAEGPHKIVDCLRARQGITGWVMQHQRAYYDLEPDEDTAPVERHPSAVRWSFPVIRGPHVVGVVSVGDFEDPTAVDHRLLKLLSGIIAEQWGCVAEICRARVAVVQDPVSGLMTRSQFLQEAPRVLERSRRLSQPVAAAAFALNGLRRLDDLGFWGLRDQAVASTGKILRRLAGPEDCIGRLNDSRFVLVWQGLGEQDARARTEEIASELQVMFEDQRKWRHAIRVHSGCCSGGAVHDTLHSLLTEALVRSESRDNCSAGAITGEVVAAVGAAGTGTD